MPKVRLLAPWTNDKGEPQAAGAVIDVSDEQAQDLNGRGQATLVEEEEKLAQQEQHFGDRATREGTAPLSGGGGQQQEEEEEDEPPKEQPKKK